MELYNILEDAPETAQANMERAEAILGALAESDVPDKYDTEGQWGFAFTGALAQHPETIHAPRLLPVRPGEALMPAIGHTLGDPFVSGCISRTL